VAKLIKCPRCQSKIDVTDLSAGSTVRCTDCGAMVRIPTGNTGKHSAVPPPAAPAPAPAPAASKDRPTKKRGMGGRQTNLFRKMSGVRPPGEKRPRGDSDRGAAGKQGNNTNMIVAASIGGLLVLGVVAFALAGGKSDKGGKGGDHMEVSDKKKKKESASTGSAKSSMPDSKSSSAPFNPFTPAPNVPAGAFQPGARGVVGDVNIHREVQNSGMKQQYESMAGSGKISEIVAQDGNLFLFAVDGMLSDTEAVARTSMEAVHQIIQKRGFAKDVQQYTRLATASNIMNFESASARAEEYGYWSRWWYTRSSQDMVEKWKADSGGAYIPPPSSNPASTSTTGTGAAAGAGEWDQTMAALRSGGGFDNQNSPEYPYFMHVKSMGKSAYPTIAKYIGHEDPAMGKAAVALLIALTGHDSERRVNDSNKAAIQAEWETWIKGQ
jgi:hypothetical protein